MILLLDTSTAECRLTLAADNSSDAITWYEYTWQANRELSRHLLSFIRDCLGRQQWEFSDIEAIGVMKGPGSFTGLRIGLTVMNTIASDRQIPIVGTSGDQWRQQALGRLSTGENDQLVMPEYGAAAHITMPRK